jgi:release factor glutamine methyltransferase
MSKVLSQPFTSPTLGQWLQESTRQLTSAGIITAWLDTLVLTEYIVKHDRAWICAHPEVKLSTQETGCLKKLLKRRAKHEPIAYIRGRQEFYGREFVITPAVMQPRPESESFIESLQNVLENDLKHMYSQRSLRIADIGCGSGVLGIIAALTFPLCQVTLLDIDPEALKVAKTNVDIFTLNISTIKSNLLRNAPKKYDILLCNLPYLPDDYKINKAAAYEPKQALFGGTNGLQIYRSLFKQVSNLPKKPLFILTESLKFQHAEMSDIAQQVRYQLHETNGLVQAFRHKDND